jgi:tetraacyldisaccharide 4'-kinase
MQEAGADPGPTPLGEGGEVLAREVLAREVLAQEVLAREASRRGLPVITASLVPEARMAEALRGRKVVAFAGIGRPAKFFSSLRAIGTVLVAERGFPDHHPFRESEIAALAAEAREAGAALATTEKDMMRVRAVIGAGDSPPLLAGIPLLVLKVGLRVVEGERLDSLIRSALAARRGGGSG